MTDQELWEWGWMATASLTDRLEPVGRLALQKQLVAIRHDKEQFDRLISRVGGCAICADCAGACCASGKYHVTGVDFLAHQAEGIPLPVPDFSGGRCPWLGSDGCRMAASYRPLTCIIFNCEMIEELLAPDDLAECRRLEGALRDRYVAVSQLFPGRYLGPLLLTGERNRLRSNDGQNIAVCRRNNGDDQ